MTRGSLQLKIKKRTQPEWLIFLLIIMPFAFGTLIEIFRVPSAIKYILDIAWVLLLVSMMANLNRGRIVIEKGSVPTYLWIAGFFALTLVVYIFNYQSILYYLWGFRNNFRFYIAFCAFIMFLNKDNVEEYLKLLDILFWINAAVCLVQYFLLGYQWDYLGGLFGTALGYNGSTNIFLTIISTKAIIYYLNKKEGLWYCIAKCSACLFLAALAGLKFYFIEFLIILLLGIVFTDISFRKIKILICAFVIIAVTIPVFVKISPVFAKFFSIDTIIKLASTGGYAQANQLNRLTTIPIISEQILTEPLQKLFGLGLGNCDTATFDFLKTPFYENYVYLRYNWFSTAFIFLETGFIGLIMFFGFFILVGIKSLFMAKEKTDNKIYCHMGLIAAVMCVLLGIYNSSLRTEAGYMIYFMLALPFIAKKDSIEK